MAKVRKPKHNFHQFNERSSFFFKEWKFSDVIIKMNNILIAENELFNVENITFHCNLSTMMVLKWKIYIFQLRVWAKLLITFELLEYLFNVICRKALTKCHILFICRFHYFLNQSSTKLFCFFILSSLLMIDTAKYWSMKICHTNVIKIIFYFKSIFPKVAVMSPEWNMLFFLLFIEHISQFIIVHAM